MVFKKILLPVIGSLLLAVAIQVVFSPNHASAYVGVLDSDDFNPGRIIDDDIFTDNSSMTAGEISKVLGRISQRRRMQSLSGEHL